MDPIKEFQALCKKNRIENTEFISKKEFEEQWRVGIPFNEQFTNCLGYGKTKKAAKQMCALKAITILSKTDVEPSVNYFHGITLFFAGGEKIPNSKNRTPFICIPKFTLPIDQLCATTGWNIYDAEERCVQKLHDLFDKQELISKRLDVLQEEYEK